MAGSSDTTKRPSRHPDMFGTPDRPRAKPLHRAHVSDAGDIGVEFTCRRCGWVSAWLSVWFKDYDDPDERSPDDLTKTESMKGIPCKVCNEPDDEKREAMLEEIRKRKERQSAPIDLSMLAKHAAEE